MRLFLILSIRLDKRLEPQGTDTGIVNEDNMTAALALPPEISAANAQFMEAFRHGDVAAMAALYQRGAQLLPAHGDLVTGFTAIQEYWRGVMEMDVREARRDITDVHMYEDTAIEVGAFTFQNTGGRVVEHGAYVTVWSKEGRWKLYRDIWSSIR